MLHKLVDCAEIETLRRGQMLFSCGEQRGKFFFLSGGLLRGYLVSDDGQEITDRFFWRPGDYIIGSSRIGVPAEICVVAMSSCQLVSVPISLVKDFVATNVEALRLYNEQLIMALEHHWSEKSVFHYGSAEQRYNWMEKLYPEWDEMIPDKYLASYLRMTPVTLSRLRRKFREAKLSMQR